MLFALHKQRATIFEIKTDSCLHRPTRRKDRLFLANLRYQDMATIRDTCEKKTNDERRLNDKHALLPEYASEDLVYRANAAGEKNPLKMEPSCPKRPVTVPRRGLPGTVVTLHGVR